MQDEIRKWTDAMETARKKLTLDSKNGGAKAEATYAEAYANLCKLDSVRFRPLRGKYTR